MNELKYYLKETDSRHSDMVDAFAYRIAAEMAKIHNDYFLIHIKKCPWWLPEFVYKWILSKVLELSRFN